MSELVEDFFFFFYKSVTTFTERSEYENLSHFSSENLVTIASSSLTEKVFE